METMESVYKPPILKKARALADAEYAVQRDAEHPDVWWVKGSTGSKYRVQVVEEFDEDNVSDGDKDTLPETGLAWVTCTCPNGMNRGGRPTCYHTAAVLLMLGDMQSGREPQIMSDPNPLNEDFVPDDKVAELKAQGYTDDEIAFLRA